MSQHLQSAYHPDADQIGAFLEQALPAHERDQMLDHLAVCPECRAIVALSLPELEQPIEPPPVPTRKSWWSGWSLAWPLAGALTAAAFAVFYIHYARSLAGALQQHQLAVERPPQPIAPQQAPAPPPAKPAPRRATTPPPRARRETTASGAAVAGNMATDRPLPQAAKPAPTTGRNVAALKSPENTPRSASAAPRVGMSRGFAGSVGMGAASGGTLSKAAPGTVASAPTPPAVEAPASHPTEAAAISPRDRSNTTVDVSSANSNSVETQSVSADAAVVQIPTTSAQISELVKFKRPLPSHLPAISSATQARRIVAIDSQNAIFASNDAGKHWKQVQAPWQGRAIAASLVAPPGTSINGLNKANVANSNASLSQNRIPAQPPGGPSVAQNQLNVATPQANLTGTVTDTSGAVIPGASIRATDTATGEVRATTTDSSGKYQINSLPAASYRVQGQSPGFQQASLDHVEVAVNNTNVADLKLNVGAVSQTVTVSASEAEPETTLKTPARPPSANEPSPIFEITTDTGAHWISADGLTWTQRF
jgi:hypothetical protein